MRILLIAFVLFGHALGQAQPAPLSLKKVAIVSLIGDQMAVDLYRRRVGTGIDTNEREVVPIDSPKFDHTALVGRAAVDALRQPGFDQLLTISKFRGQARLQLLQQTVDSGYVQGLGFDVDNFLQTQRTDTGEIGRGFIAPYAYRTLRLVDLNTGTVVRSSMVTASAAQSAARNKDGVGAWGALTSGEKIAMLRGLIQRHLDKAVLALLR